MNKILLLGLVLTANGMEDFMFFDFPHVEKMVGQVCNNHKALFHEKRIEYCASIVYEDLSKKCDKGSGYFYYSHRNNECGCCTADDAITNTFPSKVNATLYQLPTPQAMDNFKASDEYKKRKDVYEKRKKIEAEQKKDEPSLLEYIEDRVGIDTSGVDSENEKHL